MPSSRPRATRSSRRSAIRCRRSRQPSRRSGRSRRRRGTATWRSGSGWASTWARAVCARRANPGDAEDYVGIDVNYAARIAAAGNGGQIVLSRALVDALPDDLGADRGPRGTSSSSTVAFAPSRTSTSRSRSIGWSSSGPPTTTDRSARPMRRPTCRARSRASSAATRRRAAVRAELEASRIVTLTGPGGSGKTRLALGRRPGRARRLSARDVVRRPCRDPGPGADRADDRGRDRGSRVDRAARRGRAAGPSARADAACSSSTTSSSCSPTAPRWSPASTRDASGAPAPRHEPRAAAHQRRARSPRAAARGRGRRRAVRGSSA